MSFRLPLIPYGIGGPEMIDYLKRNLILFVLAGRISITIFFLFSSPVFGVVCSLLFFLSFFFLYFLYDKQESEVRRKKAYTHFLLSFFDSLYAQRGTKVAYDEACAFIRGYQKIIPLEEVKENPSAVKRIPQYEEYFLAVRQRDSLNQSHIADYRPLRDKMGEEIETREHCRAKRKSFFLASLLSLMGVCFSLALTRLIFPSFRKKLSGPLPSLFLALIPLLSICSIFLIRIHEGKENV